MDDKDIGTGTAIDKFSKSLGFLSASGMDQNSYAALQQALAMVPNKDMSKEQAIQVLHGMVVGHQRAIDRDAYLADWKRRSGGDHPGTSRWTGIDAMHAFEADHGDRYGKEGKAFEDVMRMKHGKTGKYLFSDIVNGSTDARGLDKKLGIPGFSRWFHNYGGS
jgi:hypothetical protein